MWALFLWTGGKCSTGSFSLVWLVGLVGSVGLWLLSIPPNGLCAPWNTVSLAESRRHKMSIVDQGSVDCALALP
jgi:hypothetical protein